MGANSIDTHLSLNDLLDEMRALSNNPKLRLALVCLSQRMLGRGEELRQEYAGGDWNQEFATCLDALLECHQELGGCLHELSQCDTFSSEDLELVYDLGQELRQLADMLHKAFLCERPRCANCGAACGDYCHDCGLVPLIWDFIPEELEQVPSGACESLQQLYWLVVDLLEGRCRLHEVQEMLEVAQSLIGTGPGLLQQAISQLRHSLQTRRTSQILAGCSLLCRAMEEADQFLFRIAC